ncbi:flagellar biosynthetic protein FliQ [Acidithiobacillus ferrooxidans]|jgi:flagellar biosynthetic protein FliQ|nr:flagellar biosynthetic protein FliQ [Acidithiobacillus ferrooxidans]
MTAGNGMTLLQGALEMILMAFAPIAFGTVAVGLVVTLLQSWLHWNDVSLSFVPKLLLVMGILVLGWWAFVQDFTHWFHMLSRLVV